MQHDPTRRKSTFVSVIGLMIFGQNAVTCINVFQVLWHNTVSPGASELKDILIVMLINHVPMCTHSLLHSGIDFPFGHVDQCLSCFYVKDPLGADT